MTTQDRKKITFVLPSFAGGGAERVALHLANGLNRDVYQPSFVVFEDSGPLRDEVAGDIDVVNLRRPRLRQAIWPLRKHLRRQRPEYVMTTMAYVNLSVLALCRNSLDQSRLIVREANTTDASLHAFPSARIGTYLYRRYYPKADAIICPSQAIADDFADNFSIPPELLRVQRNPVDVDRLRGATTVHNEPHDGPRFVAAGRLTPQKGFDRLIEIFATMPTAATLDIYGTGPLEASLKAQVERLGLASRVRLPGFTDNPWQHFAEADCFLLSSHWEGMPNAALEALACGTPVIATPESGGIPEVAAAAAPDTVRLAPIGPGFRRLLATVTPAQHARPRPSLLPDEFLRSTVMHQFEALLDSIEPAKDRAL